MVPEGEKNENIILIGFLSELESKERKIRTRKEIKKNKMNTKRREREKERAIGSCNFSAFLGKSGVNRVGSAVLIFLRFNLARHYVIFLRGDGRGRKGEEKYQALRTVKKTEKCEGTTDKGIYNRAGTEN